METTALPPTPPVKNPDAPGFIIIRRGGEVVGKALTLKGARKVRDRRDLEYGASVHGIKDVTGRWYI